MAGLTKKLIGAKITQDVKSATLGQISGLGPSDQALIGAAGTMITAGQVMDIADTALKKEGMFDKKKKFKF